MQFPDCIGALHFDRLLPVRLLSDSGYIFARYKDANRHIYMAKQWMNGLTSNARRKELEAEIHHMQTLSSVRLTVGPSQVRFQRYVTHQVSKDSLILISVFESGKRANLLSEKQEIAIYKRTLQFLRSFDNDELKKTGVRIPSKSRLLRIVTYFIALLVSCFRHPSLAASLLRACPAVCFWIINRYDHPVLSHGDLHGKNILVDRNRIILCDTTYACVTDPAIDMAALLLSNWNRMNVRTELLRYVAKDIGAYNRLLTAIMNVLTHYLISNDFSSLKFTNYIHAISFVTTEQAAIRARSLAYIPKYWHMVWSYVYYFFGKQTGLKCVMPKRIFGYSLQATIKSNEFSGIQVGLYKKNNQKYIVKQWNGTYKNFGYYALLQEILVSRILSFAVSRFHEPIVQVPIVTDVYYDKQIIMLVYPYRNAKTLQHASSQKTSRTLQIVYAYMDRIYESLTKEERLTIGVRSSWYYVLLYPFLVSATLIHHFSLRNLLFYTMFPTIRALWYLLEHGTFTLVHGDIHEANIMESDGSIYLLDCGQMMITYKGADVLTTLLSVQIKNTVRKHFYEVISQHYLRDINFGLLAFFAIYNLSHNTDKKCVQNYIQNLQITIPSVRGTSLMPQKSIVGGSL